MAKITIKKPAHMKDENDKSLTLIVGVLFLMLWATAAILAPAAIIKLCWLFLIG